LVSKTIQKKGDSELDLDNIRKEYGFYLKEVENLYGKKAKEVLEILLYYSKIGKKISENKIAKILKEDVNPVRKILYNFQNLGFVFSKFWKINKKGWQINSWHVDFKNLERIFSMKVPEENFSLEEDSDYVCMRCNKYFSEREALESNYICECGEFLINKKDHNYEIDKEEKIRSFVEELI